MKLSNDIRHGRQCVSALHVHLAFATKYRRKVFYGDALPRLQAIFEKVCSDFQAQLVEMNGQAEHLHLLIHCPPKHSVSSLVNSLKGVSSHLLRIECPDMEKRYWNHVLWSPSYFAASCGGAPLSIIKQYVLQQKTPLPRFIAGKSSCQRCLRTSYEVVQNVEAVGASDAHIVATCACRNSDSRSTRCEKAEQGIVRALSSDRRHSRSSARAAYRN